MNSILWILMFVIPYEAAASSKVRRVSAPQDQIITVKTALGIATIIQVPDRPNSVVVGDSDAFKVEYLDQAITIKPVHGGAKSNLYIYTDYRRFNIQLATGAESTSDYVVYLENPAATTKEIKPSIRWNRISNSLKNAAITVELKRVGSTKDGVLIVEFILRSLKREAVKPEWFWLSQGGSVKPIHNLFLSSLDVRPGEPVQGMMQILKRDIEGDNPLRFELRRTKTSFFTIPRVKSWR